MAVTIDGTNGINDTVLGSSTPAAANVTTLGASGEVTATGFTGTLDGILGSGTPAASTVTTLTASGDLSANNFAGRNRIINGAMVIDQRNAGASISVTPTAFTADRWAGQANVGGAAQQITSTIAGFANSLKYTSSASNAFFQMGQQIEYLNCYDLQNVTVSISFWAKANNTNGGSTALVVRTRTIAAINGAARFSSSAVDTSVTITTSAVKYTVTRTLPATFGALSLEFVLGAHVSGDGFEITGVQLEKSSAVTEFDHRSVGTELALCQRYYYKAVLLGWQYRFTTTVTSQSFSMSIAHPTTMRATPSVTYTLEKNDVAGQTFALAGTTTDGSSFLHTGSASGEIWDLPAYTADAEL